MKAKYPGDSIKFARVEKDGETGDIRIQQYSEHSFRTGAFIPGLIEQMPGDTPKTWPEWKTETETEAEAEAMFEFYLARAKAEGWKHFDSDGNDVTYANRAVMKYWLGYYCGGDGCILCQNSGIICIGYRDTVEFCICPAGQGLRYTANRDAPAGHSPRFEMIAPDRRFVTETEIDAMYMGAVMTQTLNINDRKAGPAKLSERDVDRQIEALADAGIAHIRRVA